MTFLEAYALHGRDSMAIAKACGLEEGDAYNLMAARADVDAGVLPGESKSRKQEYRIKQNIENRARLAEIRREARL